MATNPQRFYVTVAGVLLHCSTQTWQVMQATYIQWQFWNEKSGEGHCGAKEKVGGATQISILHGDFSLF